MSGRDVRDRPSVQACSSRRDGAHRISVERTSVEAGSENRGRPGELSTLLVASNRGPVAFARDDAGVLVRRRGSGGLVAGPSAPGRGATGVFGPPDDAAPA